MDWEKTYLDNLPRIERIAGFVARKRGHFSADETKEFVQWTSVGLFENGYAIIRKFEGRSSFSTYLTTVIGRLFSQYQIQKWGKWRPSAAAKDLGPMAIALEQLLTRDGYTFDEAVKHLTTRAGATVTAEQLWDLYIQLPHRNPRVTFVSDDLVPDSVAVESDAEARVEKNDRTLTARKIEEVFAKVLAELKEEDRVILKMRFGHDATVPVIAAALHLDQKKLYKRIDKLKDILRKALEAAGIHRADVDNLLDRGDQEIRLGVFSSEENPPAGPSKPTGEEDDGGPEE